MAGYKCKKCNTRNTVLKEWIELGINRMVSCENCGHKMNLNLQPKQVQQTPGTQVVENSQAHNHVLESNGGTNVVGLNRGKANKYILQVVKSEHYTQNLQIKDFKNTLKIFIGRNPNNIENSEVDKDVFWTVNDPYISRTHCLITVLLNNGKAQFILEDLKSANGTEVNETKLENNDQILLNIGDEVVIGDTVFTLQKQ
ncbi:FHA domain-containing protein [Bizionia arctica]|uniref:FHA domain-containing protein n=1 Tax=Bizionia arctica TaxID=1495645 RepID=A0A917LN48_9FLAO|nr:FHA domain-containing protein [Bizionia arctica]GGG44998.1 hypothetical protein GCM10010976_15740 [Bizionia arctica]